MDVEAEAQATPPPVPSPAPRTTTTRRATAAAPAARGIVTDYGYVIGELRRILIVTVGITALLIVLWLIIG